MNSLLKSVSLHKASRRADRSVSIQFITELEETPEALMEMDKLLGQRGILYFKADGELTDREIKELDSVELEHEGKTKSQRLRNVLYVLHKEMGLESDFSEYYANKMEHLIQHFKDQIPE